MNFGWNHNSPTAGYRKAEQEARDASSQADRQGVRVNDALKQIECLTLACQAMWELLRDHSELDEDHLKAKILEIDARDGTVDGKIGHKIIDCPECGQKTGTRRAFCVFCGHPVESDHTFKQ